MGRRRFGVIALAVGAPLVACAAVTGHGDYELVDCPGDCDSGTDVVIAKPDTFVPVMPKDDATTPLVDAGPDAKTPIDSGVDGGFNARVDASLPTYTPSCGRTSCNGIASPSTCIEDQCFASGWQRTVTGTGTTSFNGDCFFKTEQNVGTAFAAASLAGGPRYDFELRFRGSQQAGWGNLQSSTMAEIVSGTTTISLRVTDNKVMLCVNGACGATVNVDGIGSSDGKSANVDIYGRWGDTFANGYVRLLAGPDGACNARYELPLPSPASGAIQARVGCFASKCDEIFDEISFSQRPL